jgi:hypothetical protein
MPDRGSVPDTLVRASTLLPSSFQDTVAHTVLNRIRCVTRIQCAAPSDPHDGR